MYKPPFLVALLLLLPPPITFWTAILIHFLNAIWCVIHAMQTKICQLQSCKKDSYGSTVATPNEKRWWKILEGKPAPWVMSHIVLFFKSINLIWQQNVLCKYDYKSYRIEINVMITFLNLLTVRTLTSFTFLPISWLCQFPERRRVQKRSKSK